MALMVALAAPLGCFLVLAAWLVFGEGLPSERGVARLARSAFTISFLAVVVGAVAFFGAGGAGLGATRLELGEWFRVDEQAFRLTLVSDRLGWVMMLVVTGLTGLAGRFAVTYLHRDAGFARFFLLVSAFLFGMLLVSASGSLDQLFIGWEVVGLSSALLVGFFQERRAPTQAGLRVFTVYRLCDLGLLLATAALHHAVGEASFVLGDSGTDDFRLPAIASSEGTLIAIGLIVGALGKSAQLPVGSWLPRAMEGPTPSSALFYGGVSVHAGVFLLLRAAPVIAASTFATVLLAAVGGSTALYAGLVGRAQTDAKGTLAFATMAQVGVMFVEIALGWYSLALVHLVAHALLRLLQLLRAPSALADAVRADAALGRALRVRAESEATPHPYLYRLALDRGFLDTAQTNWLLRPVLSLSRFLERWEARWLRLLEGSEPKPQENEAAPPLVASPRSEP
jgi:NADH:ubiquinone oxidoreductase subunit 5 (subunit L)/multisubunit Na+/H+ antiporter MnhA subunit